MSVPLVDLSRCEDEVAKAIRAACVRHGFFYISKHGVQEETIKAMFASSRAFFALPVEVKSTAKQNEHNRGWTPMYEETLDPAKQRSGDTKEGYYVGRDVALNHPDPRERGPLRAPNLFPAEDILPHFRSSMELYHAEMTQLARRLMRPFALGLGLPGDFFAEHFERPTALLRPLHYAAFKSQPEQGLFAAGAHSDYGVLTILATDETPGLEIQLEDGSFAPVPPMDGTFIVNVGDLCEIWTNGLFKSTVHRVVTSGESERYSAAFFWEPNFECLVSPLSQCVTEDRPRRYEPVVYGDYILSKYAATHAGYSSTA